jgi:hypothetical protein
MDWSGKYIWAPSNSLVQPQGAAAGRRTVQDTLGMSRTSFGWAQHMGYCSRVLDQDIQPARTWFGFDSAGHTEAEGRRMAARILWLRRREWNNGAQHSRAEEETSDEADYRVLLPRLRRIHR